MTIAQDIGIMFEIGGFIFLLLTSGRNPTSGFLLNNTHKDDKFDVFRKKIIHDEDVHLFLILGIGLVVVGLILQFSIFNLQ